MKTIISIIAICASTCLCAIGITAEVTTNEAGGGATALQLSGTHESANSMILHLNQLERNSKGNAEYRKLREDIDRAGIDITTTNGTNIVTSTKRSELLATLTRLQPESGRGIENTVNPTPEQKQTIAQIREVRKSLAEAMSIPVWNENKWMDGRSLAFNNADLPITAKNALVQLNYWEQNYGDLSLPENMRGVLAISGEASAAISSLRKQSEREGFSLELDRSLGIWKIQRNKTK